MTAPDDKTPNYSALVKEDRDFCSNAISVQVRYIALGTLAVVWAILSGSSKELLAAFGAHSSLLLFIALLCILALIADLIQYQLGLRAAELAKTVLDNNPGQKPWDDKWPSRVWRNRFFFVKQVLAALAAILLVVLLGFVLVHKKNAGSGEKARDSVIIQDSTVVF